MALPRLTPRIVAVLTVITLLGSLGVVAGAAAQPATGSDRYIVVLRAGVDPLAVAQEHAARFGVAVSHVYRHALTGYAAEVPAARLARIQADPRVRFVSEDRVVTIFAETTPTGVMRIGADTSTTPAPDGVNVAVIDTGIDVSHPDLNVGGGVNCQTGSSYNDGNGHGSHVSGIIGARRNNGIGVAGVLPGARLWAVRVLNNAGSGRWSNVVCGIDWVTGTRTDGDPTNDIAVANMSLGGTGADDGKCGTANNDALHAAICNSVAAGVTYVVAAGNSAADFKGFVPAAYGEVLTVTAIADFNGAPGGGAAATCRSDVDDTAADFSNYTVPGSPDASHTIAAPGVCIYSTYKGDGYATLSGTSMASPHVAGTVARCIASGACAGTPAQITSKILSDAEGHVAGYGFLGDPTDPIQGGNTKRGFATLDYGYLVWSGDY